MLALAAFIVGLVVLFKGAFRLGNRTVSQAQSRPIALYLMAPSILYFCASTLLLSDYIQVNRDGSFVLSPSDTVVNTIGTMEFILVGIGVALTLFSIYGTQRADGTPRPQPSRIPPAPQQLPNIMTVAEAAAYMRLTERDVLNLIEQSKLGAVRSGDGYRIARIAIEDFMGRT